MVFSEKLKRLMDELQISQVEVSRLTGICKSSISQYLTGICKSSISQYLSGKNEPTEARKKKIALALGVQEDYFRQLIPIAEIQKNDNINVPVPVIAKLMGKSKEWVEHGLQDRVFPWGYAVKRAKWGYWISSVKFTEYTGIEIPMNDV